MTTLNNFKKIVTISIFIILTLFLSSVSQQADAHEVAKVKGKKVLIVIEGGRMRVGGIYYSVTRRGLKKGIIRIDKVKNSRAIGRIVKGKARKGYILKLRSSKKSTKSAKRRGRTRGRKGKKSKKPSMYWGGMAGFSSNTMSVKFPNDTGTADLSGSGVSVKGLFDFPLFSSLWFRGLVGAETFDVKGTATQASCDGSTDCKVTLTYLTADLWGRFLFSKGSFRPWAGAGFLLLFPMTKELNALDEKSITNTSNFAAGFGFDYFLGKTKFIPFQVEYDLFPSSDQVSASSIAIRVGFGMSF